MLFFICLFVIYCYVYKFVFALDFFLVFYLCCLYSFYFFFFKQKTAYEMRISDWSSDVCSSDSAGQAPPKRYQSAARSPATRHTFFRPTLCSHAWYRATRGRAYPGRSWAGGALAWNGKPSLNQAGVRRSEERSVGKAWVSTCRSRWSPEH